MSTETRPKEVEDLREEEIKEALDTPVNPDDFTDAEHEAVEKMAGPIIRQAIANKKFKGRRNRKAWMRMNRPHKIDAMEKGASKIYALLDRCFPAPQDPEVPVEEPEFSNVTEQELEEPGCCGNPDAFLEIPEILRADKQQELPL